MKVCMSGFSGRLLFNHGRTVYYCIDEIWHRYGIDENYFYRGCNLFIISHADAAPHLVQQKFVASMTPSAGGREVY